MSVPLDRLYNFLHDVCNHRDLIIYRFFPHGSRKIEDLTTLYPRNVLNYKNNFVFYHDQEPLNFDLYSQHNLDCTQLEKIRPYNLDNNHELIKTIQTVSKKIMPSMNLRWAIGLFYLGFPIVLVHSEKRSAEVERYEQIQFIGCYWWCHALIARDWFRYAEIDPILTTKSIKYDFLIYNRAWSGTREYRLKFTELLIKNNLVNHCMTWFNPVDNEQHYTMHKFKNSNLQINNHKLETYYNLTQTDSTASADYCSTDYQQTGIEVVLETLFDDNRLHLTEKALRPIACGQPFMLAATHGSLEYLRSYGFETFSPWIDETYDTIEDPAQRLEAIVQEMKRIANLSKAEKTFMYAGLEEITIRNKKLFFSDAWQKLIVDEYKTNFDQAMKKLSQF